MATTRDRTSLSTSLREVARRGGSVVRHETDFVRRTRQILVRTARAFTEDNVTRLGAALAFYTTVAVAPLMVVAMAVAGFFFEENAARERLIGEIEILAGRHAGAALEAVQKPTA